jgi:hypothetical protein
MKWLWLIIGIIPLIFTYSAAKRKREQRYELQFWEKDDRPIDDCYAHAQIHFPSMMMRFTYNCVGGPHSVRFYHVRRTGNSLWEMKLTDKSWLMELKEKEHTVTTHSSALPENAEKELCMMKKEGNTWFTNDWYDASLETAYQRFIHTPDIPIAALSWIEEEEKEKIFAELEGKSSA